MSIVTKAATPDYHLGHDRIWGDKVRPSDNVTSFDGGDGKVILTEEDLARALPANELDGVAKVPPSSQLPGEVEVLTTAREVEVLTTDGWVLIDLMSLKDGDTFRMFDRVRGERKPVVGRDGETQWVVEGSPFTRGSLAGVKVRDEKA